jgi:hypothetical protein
LAKSTEAVDAKYLFNTVEHIAAKKGTWYQDVANKIRSL